MNMAEGSVEECRYFLILAKGLGYGDTERLAASLEEVSRLLNAYVAAILTSGSWLALTEAKLALASRYT